MQMTRLSVVGLCRVGEGAAGDRRRRPDDGCLRRPCDVRILRAAGHPQGGALRDAAGALSCWGSRPAVRWPVCNRLEWFDPWGGNRRVLLGSEQRPGSAVACGSPAAGWMLLVGMRYEELRRGHAGRLSLRFHAEPVQCVLAVQFAMLVWRLVMTPIQYAHVSVTTHPNKVRGTVVQLNMAPS